MAGIAFVASDATLKVLANNNDVVILRLNLVLPGSYVVFGRAVVQSVTGPLTARITHSDGSSVVDRVEVVILPTITQTVHLQGTAIVPVGTTQIVDIRCSMQSGFSTAASLFAVQVSALKLNTN